MGAQSPGSNFALGATQVDQRAGERPWTSPDHLPPPVAREPETADRWWLGLLIALIGLGVLFLVAVFIVHLIF